MGPLLSHHGHHGGHHMSSWSRILVKSAKNDAGQECSRLMVDDDGQYPDHYYCWPSFNDRNMGMEWCTAKVDQQN